MIWGFVFGLETFTQKASGTLDFLIQCFRFLNGTSLSKGKINVGSASSVILGLVSLTMILRFGGLLLVQ